MNSKTYSASVQELENGKFRVCVTYSQYDGENFNEGFCPTLKLGLNFDSVPEAESALIREYPGMRFLNFGGDKNQYRWYLQTPKG